MFFLWHQHLLELLAPLGFFTELKLQNKSKTLAATWWQKMATDLFLFSPKIYLYDWHMGLLSFKTLSTTQVTSF
jgi:hypothetical protein